MSNQIHPFNINNSVDNTSSGVVSDFTLWPMVLRLGYCKSDTGVITITHNIGV